MTNSAPTCWVDVSWRRYWFIARPRRSATTASRARSRKARRSSPSSSAIGAPKVTEHRIGTGTTSPLGITRCTLSIQAGTSTTSGNIWASV